MTVTRSTDRDREIAYEAMFRAYEQRVLAYALRRAPVEVAKDAVADVLLTAWRRFDELPADPFPWLVEATRKALANQRRSSARQRQLTVRLAGLPAEHPEDRPHERPDADVATALRSLSVADREALTLIAWDELTPTQAARSLGCSPTAFRVRLHRARRRFERALRRATSAEQRNNPTSWREAPLADAKEALR
jgi:RNA polymerase sigma-70 factor, ECF subfamily